MTVIIDFFANFNQTEGIMAITLGVVAAVALVLRFALYGAYSAGVVMINKAAKGIKAKADVEKLAGGTFARAAKEYAAMLAVGGRAEALDAARMTVAKNRLYFFNFNSLAGFIRLLEGAFLPFTILFVLAAQARVEFLLLAAGIFLLMIILAAVFDINAGKERYITTLAYVLARDVGRLYPTDAAGAVYTFGADLNEYLSRQSAMYNEVLNKIKSEFTGAITSSTSAMAKGVDATLSSIANHEALYSASLKEDRAEAREDIILLTNAVQKLNGIAAAMEARQAATDGELGLVRENQKALEAAVASYETSLKEITAQMGDAMGKIVAYHLGGAGGQIAEGIADSVKGALSGAAGREAQLKSILEDFAEQNRYQTKLLLDLQAQREAGENE